MSHILVTGATGFIGSHVVRRLLQLKQEKGWAEEIVCLVRATSDLSALKGLDVKLVIGDLCQPKTLIQAVRGASYIYHVAAELYVLSEKQFLDNNAEGTKHLLDAAVAHAGDTLQRFLLVSSQAAAGPAPDENPIDENRPPGKPVSWYAKSKLMAEEYAAQYMNQFPVTIVRPCSVYGERDQSFYQAFKGAAMRFQAVAGFRKSYTGMIYGPDLAEGIVAAALSPNTRNQTYFLSNPENYTVKKMMKTMGEAVGKPWGIPLPIPFLVFKVFAVFATLYYWFMRKEPVPTLDKVRDLSQRYWLCTPQKARDDFGWQAGHTLLDGMKATYNYIKQEEATLKRMPEENKKILWLKYFLLSFEFGILIEVLAAFGDVYFFRPWWLVFPVIVLLWGLVFGSIAMATRTRGLVLQFIPGFVILFGGELLNSYFLNAWEFGDGLLHGVTQPVARAAILGVATGFLIPIINFLMGWFYRRKLRLG